MAVTVAVGVAVAVGPHSQFAPLVFSTALLVWVVWYSAVRTGAVPSEWVFLALNGGCVDWWVVEGEWVGG